MNIRKINKCLYNVSKKNERTSTNSCKKFNARHSFIHPAPGGQITDWSLTNFMICSVFAFGVFLLLIAITKGNFLIFAGPVTLWAFVIFLTLPRKVKEKRKKALRPTNKSLLICKALGAVVVLLVATGVWLPKLRGGFASNGQIGMAMSEARVLFENGYVEEAILRFRNINVPKHLPRRNAEKYHNLGALLIRTGRLQEAYEALKKAVIYDPQDVEAYLFLAQITYHTGSYSESFGWLNKAKELDPCKQGLSDLETMLKTQLQKEGL